MANALLSEERGAAAKRLGEEARKLPWEADAEWPENPPCDPPCWAQTGIEIPTTKSATAARCFMPSSYACFRKLHNESGGQNTCGAFSRGIVYVA